MWNPSFWSNLCGILREDGTRFLKSVKFSVNWWSKFLQKTPVEVVFVWLRELYNSSRRNMQMDEMKLFHSPQWMNPFQMAEQKYIVNSFLVMVGWNRTSPCNQSRASFSTRRRQWRFEKTIAMTKWCLFFPERLGEGRFLGAVSLSSLTWLAWFKLLNLNLLDLTCLTWTCLTKTFLTWLSWLDLGKLLTWSA